MAFFKPNPNYKLASTLAFAKYGVPLSAARYITSNLFSIPKQFRDLYQTLYILSWKASYFQDHMKEGMISTAECSYDVIYHNCTPVDIRKSTDVYLSFRKIDPVYLIRPTVLVAITPTGKKL